MSPFTRHRSYTEKVLAARKRRKLLARGLAFALVVAAVHGLLLRTYRISTDLMAPGLRRGDLVLSAPLLGGLRTIFGKLPPLAPLARGELVVVRPESYGSVGPALRAWDALGRFLSFQLLSPLVLARGRGAGALAVYRIVGTPGDKVRRRGSLFEVAAAGKDQYAADPGPAGQASDDSQTTVLGQGQYFVASDDRSTLSGSALWGAIGTERMEGRLVLLFWPLDRARLL